MSLNELIARRLSELEVKMNQLQRSGSLARYPMWVLARGTNAKVNLGKPAVHHALQQVRAELKFPDPPYRSD